MIAPSPHPSTSPPPISASGQLLTLTHSYLVFTTGDAVRIEKDARIASNLSLGQAIRVDFDPNTHLAVSVTRLSGAPAPGAIPPEQLGSAYLAVSPGSARSAKKSGDNGASRSIAVTFEVTVPNDTPSNDDIYLSTDRSNFSPAELKMNRLDAHRWSVTLPLVTQATLHYQFTRGNYTAVERNHSGGVLPPRALNVQEGCRVNDTVARWADTS